MTLADKARLVLSAHISLDNRTPIAAHAPGPRHCNGVFPSNQRSGEIKNLAMTLVHDRAAVEAQAVLDASFTKFPGLAQQRHGACAGGDESATPRTGCGAGRQRPYCMLRSMPVIRRLLKRGADLKKVRMVVEALGALRDLHAA